MTHDSLAEFDAVLRNDFSTFVHKVFLTLNPGAIFLDNWHHDAISHHLMKVQSGDITRLIFNLPPRSLKSTIISVAYSAFLLGHNPERRIIAISYSAELSAKHAADFRAVVESEWYQRAFPRMRIARATELEIQTTARGFRKATSVNATLTGLGGDCFIIDDPQKPVDAQSEALRNSLNQWFSSTLISRLDNKNTSAIILVMQRVHLQDLAGYLMEKSSDWTVLSLPAIAETDEVIEVAVSTFHRRRAGEALHPEHESLATLERQRSEQTPADFSAQYQQAPVPAGGVMIKREWFHYYDRLPQRDYSTKLIFSLDTAAKGGAQNDWSVITVWLLKSHCFYLIDMVRGRYEYPLLRQTLIELGHRYKPDVILIEDASTGTPLAQDIKRTEHWHVLLVPVERDKMGRLYVQQAKFSSGKVLFPRNAAYTAQVEMELLTFPQGKTDDIVDSISQALAFDSLSTYDSTYSGF